VITLCWIVPGSSNPANRQAQLNREASTRLEAQATAARTTALATQGRDANGNPITGAFFTPTQIERRPAANRAPNNIWKSLLSQSPFVVYNGPLQIVRMTVLPLRSAQVLWL
jgi:hypothetical protein